MTPTDERLLNRGSLAAKVAKASSCETGAETVEIAVTIGILVLVLFSGFELGWAFMQSSNLKLAARVGAREASLDGATAGLVVDSVQRTLRELGIHDAEVRLEPADPAEVAPGTSINVVVSVDYSDVQLLGLHAIMPLPDRLTGRASMIKEPSR